MIASSILQIDSRDRISGTPSDFTISLNNSSITNASRVCPIGCSFTHVFPNIDSNRQNDTLTVKFVDYFQPRYNKFCLEISSWNTNPGQLMDNAPADQQVKYNVIFDINLDYFKEDARKPTLGDHRGQPQTPRKDINNVCFMLQQQLQLNLTTQGCPNTDYIKFVPISMPKGAPIIRILRSPSMIFRVRRFEDFKVDSLFPPEFKELEDKEGNEWLIPCKFPMKVADDGLSVGQSLYNKALDMNDYIREGWLNVWANNIRTLKGHAFAVEWSEYKNNKRHIEEITCGYVDIEIAESLFFLGAELKVSIVSGSYTIDNVIAGLNHRLNTLLTDWTVQTNNPRRKDPNPANFPFITFSIDPIQYITKIGLNQMEGDPLCFFIPENQELARQLGLYAALDQYSRREDAMKYSDNINTPIWRALQYGKTLVDIYPISGLFIFAPGLVNANTINSKGENLPLLARISNLGAFGQKTVWENWSAFELFLQPSSSSISNIRIYLTDLDYKPITMNADWNITVAVFSITNN